MKVAFTMDDLPLWPQSRPPEGYSAAGIVKAIRSALRDNGIDGVYAFSNSWSLEEQPDLAEILDDWCADGHFVANHTHSHWHLPNVAAETFVADIDTAEQRLSPWLSSAPMKLFRHPLCHWGETPEKLAAVNSHLDALGLTAVDVTSWCYEWMWNRAYRTALEANDPDARAFVTSSFLDFAVAQLRHDMDAACDWFGEEIVGITLGHNVPFFADIASAYFERLRAEGVEFVPLEDALRGPVATSVGSVVSGEFLVLQQKLAKAAGRALPKTPDAQSDVFQAVARLAEGRSD